MQFTTVTFAAVMATLATAAPVQNIWPFPNLLPQPIVATAAPVQYGAQYGAVAQAPVYAAGYRPGLSIFSPYHPLNVVNSLNPFSPLNPLNLAKTGYAAVTSGRPY